jgi:Cof subfamily protein (haloacid dehalogenase superfamily)
MGERGAALAARGRPVTAPDVRAPEAPRPQFEPRALVLDLDNTTISEGTYLHPRTEAAVQRAARRLPTIVATGRQYVSALPWAQRMKVTEPMVCFEGAVVRTMPDGEGPHGSVLLEQPLGAEPGVESLHIARQHDWHYHAYDGEQLVAERDRPELHYYCEIAGVDYRLVPDLEPVLRAGSPKGVVVIRDVEEARRCMELMRDALGASAHVTRSLREYVEIVDPEVRKSRACELVCRRHGVGLADVVAIGDAPNDIELLDAAGFSVAVDAGRYPEVLEHADVTCVPPTEGGVADVLEALGLA